MVNNSLIFVLYLLLKEALMQDTPEVQVKQDAPHLLLVLVMLILLLLSHLQFLPQLVAVLLLDILVVVEVLHELRLQLLL